MVFACAAATDPARISVADRVVENVGAWKVSFRSMRWCTIWYLWRKSSVLCEGSGNNDCFMVDLGESANASAYAFENLLVEVLLGGVVHHPGLLKGANDLQPLSRVFQLLILFVMILHLETRHAEAGVAVQSWSGWDPIGFGAEVEAALSAQIGALYYPPAQHGALQCPEYALEGLTISFHNHLTTAFLPNLSHLLQRPLCQPFFSPSGATVLPYKCR
jgi:hypothetical protein